VRRNQGCSQKRRSALQQIAATDAVCG